MIRDFTPTELAKYRKAIENFKSPWITRILYKIWFGFFRYAIYPIFVILLICAIVYNFTNNSDLSGVLWKAMKGTILIIIGYGILMAISHVIEGIKIKKEAKKLGISILEWNYIVNKFGIIRK